MASTHTTYTVRFDARRGDHVVGFARADGSHGTFGDVFGCPTVEEAVADLRGRLERLGKAGRIWVRDASTRETLHSEEVAA